MEDWTDRYPAIARRHHDSRGHNPQHTFFYPWDEFDPGEFKQIAHLCSEGFGEIEFHLHHSGDTEAGLRTKLREGLAAFRDGGALTCWPDGRPAFGFIHGNHALDNSRHSNGRDFCGVNNELNVLQEEGCFADFTFPSWRVTSQPRLTNSIYYAVDEPDEPKSHDVGVPASVGGIDQPGLLLIQGALYPFLGWKSILRPRLGIDDSDLAGSFRYSPARLDRWIRAGIHVKGSPNRIFIKLHCHGAADANRDLLLRTELEALFSDAEARYNDGRRYSLHYVTARQMYNIVKATEAGIEDIEASREWLLPHPEKVALKALKAVATS